MEVPLVWDLHPSGRGDRESGFHRLVVSSPSGAATTSRRTILGRSGAGIAACALALSGCASKSRQPRVHKIPPEARNVDVELLNGLLDREHKAIAAYTAAIPLL